MQVRVLLFGLFISIFLYSCTGTVNFPSQWKILKGDRQEGLAVLNNKELYVKQRKAALFITNMLPTKCSFVQDFPVDAFTSAWKRYGNFVFVYRNTGKKYSNLQYAWSEASGYKVDFIVLLQLKISPSCNQKQVNAKLAFHVFPRKSERIYNRSNFMYSKDRLSSFNIEMKRFLREAFPLQIFVLETRENSKYVRIAAGRSQGVTSKDKFALYPTPSRMIIKPILAHVVFIQEHTAWVELEKPEEQVLRGYYAYSIK